MNKWAGLTLTGLWLIAGTINIFQKRPAPSVFIDFFAAAIFLFLTVCQSVFEKKGENGLRVLKRIQIAALVLVILCGVAIILLAIL